MIRAPVQVLYALTAGIAGYVSASLYRQLGGASWVRSVLLTMVLFCGPLLLTFMVLNTIAIAYKSTAALPFGTICIMVILWALVTVPLTVLGAIVGKNGKVGSPPLPLSAMGITVQPCMPKALSCVCAIGPHVFPSMLPYYLGLEPPRAAGLLVTYYTP